MDTNRIRDLLDRRDEIDRELNAAISALSASAVAPPKRVVKCRNCGEEGHTARSCTRPPSDTLIENSASPTSP